MLALHPLQFNINATRHGLNPPCQGGTWKSSGGGIDGIGLAGLWKLHIGKQIQCGTFNGTGYARVTTSAVLQTRLVTSAGDSGWVNGHAALYPYDATPWSRVISSGYGSGVHFMIWLGGEDGEFCTAVWS